MKLLPFNSTCQCPNLKPWIITLQVLGAILFFSVIYFTFGIIVRNAVFTASEFQTAFDAAAIPDHWTALVNTLIHAAVIFYVAGMVRVANAVQKQIAKPPHFKLLMVMLWLLLIYGIFSTGYEIFTAATLSMNTTGDGYTEYIILSTLQVVAMTLGWAGMVFGLILLLQQIKTTVCPGDIPSGIVKKNSNDRLFYRISTALLVLLVVGIAANFIEEILQQLYPDSRPAGWSIFYPSLNSYEFLVYAALQFALVWVIVVMKRFFAEPENFRYRLSLSKALVIFALVEAATVFYEIVYYIWIYPVSIVLHTILVFNVGEIATAAVTATFGLLLCHAARQAQVSQKG